MGGRSEPDPYGNGDRYYDDGGRYVGRSSTDAWGNTIYHDDSGAYVGRSRPDSWGGGTTYHDASGHVTGRSTSDGFGNGITYRDEAGSYAGRSTGGSYGGVEFQGDPGFYGLTSDGASPDSYAFAGSYGIGSYATYSRRRRRRRASKWPDKAIGIKVAMPVTIVLLLLTVFSGRSLPGVEFLWLHIPLELTLGRVMFGAPVLVGAVAGLVVAAPRLLRSDRPSMWIGLYVAAAALATIGGSLFLPALIAMVLT